MATKIDIDLAIRYITGKIDSSERKEFEKWLRESSYNNQQFDDFKESWQISGKAYQNYNPDIAEGWKIVSEKTINKLTENNKIRMLVFQIIKVAASVLLLVSLGIVGKILYDGSQREEMAIYISTNDNKAVVLSDSTHIWLNARSQLNAPKVFKRSQRTVYLIGEGFFEVTKNPKRPFIVHAHNTTSEVLGTSFNLNATENDSIVSLTVVTGKVAFSNDQVKERKLVLLPGQKGKIDLTAGISSMELNRNANFLAWKTGKLQFKNASLTEVCNALTDYYKVKIVAANHISNKPYLFTGNFDNAPIDDALNVIELTLGIRFIKTGNIITIQ